MASGMMANHSWLYRHWQAANPYSLLPGTWVDVSSGIPWHLKLLLVLAMSITFDQGSQIEEGLSSMV